MTPSLNASSYSFSIGKLPIPNIKANINTVIEAEPNVTPNASPQAECLLYNPTIAMIGTKKVAIKVKRIIFREPDMKLTIFSNPKKAINSGALTSPQIVPNCAGPPP